jgi:hypothetical protein
MNGYKNIFLNNQSGGIETINNIKTNFINNIPVNNFLTLSGTMNFVTLDGNQIITGPKQITNLTADKIYCQEFYNNGDINIGHSDGNEGFNINLGGPYVGGIHFLSSMYIDGGLALSSSIILDVYGFLLYNRYNTPFTIHNPSNTPFFNIIESGDNSFMNLQNLTLTLTDYLTINTAKTTFNGILQLPSGRQITISNDVLDKQNNQPSHQPTNRPTD